MVPSSKKFSRIKYMAPGNNVEQTIVLDGTQDVQIVQTGKPSYDIKGIPGKKAATPVNTASAPKPTTRDPAATGGGGTIEPTRFTSESDFADFMNQDPDRVIRVIDERGNSVTVGFRPPKDGKSAKILYDKNGGSISYEEDATLARFNAESREE